MIYLQFSVILHYQKNILRNQGSYFGLMLIELREDFNSLLTFCSNINRFNLIKSDYQYFLKTKKHIKNELSQKYISELKIQEVLVAYANEIQQ